MWKLQNKTLNYAWGSPTAIPSFVGAQATGDPVAELWIGTHPIAPSTVDGQLLADMVNADQERFLGARVASTFHELPFLVKLLAADTPLSLQVHPKAEAAVAGYQRENAAGIELTDPVRTYKDPHAKPEIFMALTETTTLVGFRPPEQTHELLSLFSCPWADTLSGIVADGSCMKGALDFLTSPKEWSGVRDKILEVADKHPENDALQLVKLLDSHFPGDPGAGAPLLMNIATYSPGEVLYTGDAVIHAHVSGFGVEVMTSSDNVIRAGLTSKHIDREALLNNIDAVPGPPTFLAASGPYNAFTPPVSEFAATVVRPGDPCPTGPRIALALADSTIEANETLPLARGEAAFVADCDGDLTVTSGEVLVAFVP